VAWFRIQTRLTNQDDPRYHVVWYGDTDSLDVGGLLLWEDDAGAVARFQLWHSPFLVGREYLLDWQMSRGSRLGEVLSDAGAGLRRGSPQIRYHGVDRGVLDGLVGYFAANGSVLPWRHRAAVAAVLHAAEAEPPATPRGHPRAHPLLQNVSGKEGGVGNGTAATRRPIGR
jgi:hypothetical protein